MRRFVGFGTALLVAMLGLQKIALAGGFAVREQSTAHQGASFAGNGVGTAISSQFWNPAALGNAGDGLNLESGAALLITSNEFAATGGAVLPSPFSLTTDTGRNALVPSSYASYRLSRDFVLGVGLNAPFGLGSKPDDNDWVGATHGRSAKLTTYNLNPNFAYQIAPGLHVGAGLQLQYADLVFKFAAGSPAAGNAVLDIEDKLGVGFTLGAMWQATPRTTVGVGFRSSVEHDFEGDISVVGLPAGTGGNTKADLELPETVTLSLRHAFSEKLRGLATVEWSNWSRFDNVPVICTSTAAALDCDQGDNLGILDANWDDGWFYSLGFEYDYQPGLTFRAGIAYEESPAQTPEQRLFQVPDSDRIWLSAGLSYNVTENSTIDLAYTHIFVEDAEINRGTLTVPAANLIADREASVDIISVGYKMKWGGN